MGLQSYKPYSRLITVISGLIIIIASLDATQVINLFPDYASQINGLLAPAISQELRVGRAEELVKEDLSDPDDPIQVVINLDGEDIIRKLEEQEDVELADGEDSESDTA